MPCGMQSIRVNRTETNKDLLQIGDELTHRLDLVRESLLAGATPDFSANDAKWAETIEEARHAHDFEISGPTHGTLTDEAVLNEVISLFDEYLKYKTLYSEGKITKSVLKKIERDQVKHRKEDLKRLAHEFIESGHHAGLDKVLNADPTKPLEGQLGFDPDQF